MTTRNYQQKSSIKYLNWNRNSRKPKAHFKLFYASSLCSKARLSNLAFTEYQCSHTVILALFNLRISAVK